jgi:hypothetical protein
MTTITLNPNAPDFLRTLLEDALADAEASRNRPLQPGEPDPRHYPDFGDYWEACLVYEQTKH